VNVYQNIQSYKIKYLLDCVYWTCLFKSTKNSINRNTNETDWINSHLKKILCIAEHIRNMI
jgi:hypothetical protein